MAMRRNPGLTAMLAVVLIAAMGGEAAIAAPDAAMALHCRNTTSGATWTIPVDLAGKRVEHQPARITPAAISWEDKTLHFYRFDRKTGVLEMHAASSTGGFYLRNRCVLTEAGQ